MNPTSFEWPTNKVLVPQEMHEQLMAYVHYSPSSGHPGIQRTTGMVSKKFWWPTINNEVKNFVLSCIIFAQSRTHHHLHSGFLELLLISHWPWFTTESQNCNRVVQIFGRHFANILISQWTFAHVILSQVARWKVLIRRFLRSYWLSNQHKWNSYLPWTKSP